MLAKEKIIKVDILTPNGVRILTATNKQFSISTSSNPASGKIQTMMIFKGRELPEIEMGVDISIIVYMRSGERVNYPCKVSLSTDLQLNLLILTYRAEIVRERRRFYKVEADLPCFIKSIKRAETKTSLAIPVAGQIKDLNLGGVFICVSAIKLIPSDCITITLEVLGKTIELDAEIIRMQYNAAGDISGYGCKFLNVPPIIEEYIAKFVFQVQLEQRKNQDKG